MIKNIIIGIGILVIVLLVFSAMNKGGNVGSVSQGSEYVATSTAADNVYGAFTGDQLLKTGHGVFGSVVITGVNTGIVNFYNATTSDVTKRTGNIASSTILMASIPTNMATGTYTFDVVFTSGLLVELETGIMPTTTITYR